MIPFLLLSYIYEDKNRYYNENRIKENINVFDFALTEDEMDNLKSLDKANPMIGDPANPVKQEFAMTW